MSRREARKYGIHHRRHGHCPGIELASGRERIPPATLPALSDAGQDRALATGPESSDPSLAFCLALTYPSVLVHVL